MNSELSKNFDLFDRHIDKLDSFNEYLESSIKSKNDMLDQYISRSGLYQKCSEIIKTWLEDMLDKNVNSIAELVSNGLDHVIDDQQIQFSIKQEPKYNKISMRFVMSKDGHEGDPMDSYGGGAVHISSLILRLAIMSRLNMANLMILDESLNALAAKYIPNCGEFIKQLSEKTGINILMVTHSPEFLNCAHTSYEGNSVSLGVKDGHEVHKLELKKLTNSSI